MIELTKKELKFTTSEGDVIISTDKEFDVDIIEAIMDRPIMVKEG